MSRILDLLDTEEVVFGKSEDYPNKSEVERTALSANVNNYTCSHFNTS